MMMRPRARRQGGFTLLELVVVVVIIGILTLITVQGVTSGPKRERDTERKSALRTVKAALESYYNETNTYPNTSYGSSDTTGLGHILVPAYIPHLPLDPRNVAPYVYSYSQAGSGYTLTAHFENRHDPQVTTQPDIYAVKSDH